MSEENGSGVVVPHGLYRCEICTEYRGVVIEAYSNGYFPIKVACICEGVFCRNCKIRRVHRPISNYFDEIQNHVWHVPYFSPCICLHCRPLVLEQKNKEYLNRKRQIINEVRRLAKDLDCTFIGVWSLGGYVLEHKMSHVQGLADYSRVKWKFGNHTIETYGGLIQIFPTEWPDKGKIIPIKEWLLQPLP